MSDAVDELIEALMRYRFPDLGDDSPMIGGTALVKRVLGDPDAAIVDRLIAALPGIPDPFAAAALSGLLGSRIEASHPAGPLGAALAARLPADFAAARRFAEALEAKHGIASPNDAPAAKLAAARRADPRGGAAWAGQQFATMAAMTAWARDPVSRRAAAAQPALIADAQALADHDGYAYYIAQLLTAADGIELVILVPGVRRGFVVELEVVRNAAHLFALLESTLVGPACSPDRRPTRRSPRLRAARRSTTTSACSRSSGTTSSGSATTRRRSPRPPTSTRRSSR